MNDVREVLGTIVENPGLLASQIAEMLDLPYRRVEDAIWELWSNGTIQCDPDSTLRATRDDEEIFRVMAEDFDR